MGKMQIASLILTVALLQCLVCTSTAGPSQVSDYDRWLSEQEELEEELASMEVARKEKEVGLDGPVNLQSLPSYNPIVLWHGMGDTAVGVKYALRFLSDEMTGVYIKSLQLGENPAKDLESGYFRNVNEQIDTVCQQLQEDSKLQGGYNAIGLSQGGQFLRAVAQKCPNPPMLNLISLGGQHQGVFGLPKCSAPKHQWCEIIDKLITHVAYADWVQKFLVQAEYWHDPLQEKQYVENSVFLADINNERVKNVTYKQNLLKLKNLVLVKFLADTIVQPKESEWFEYFIPGQDKKMYKLHDSPLYKEDWIGLKALNESGRLHLKSVDGDHLQFSKQWFKDQIMLPFLM